MKTHKNGGKIMAEYAPTNTILENKELFVRIVVGFLVDINGGSL